MCEIAILLIDDNPSSDVFKRLFGQTVDRYELMSGKKLQMRYSGAGRPVSIVLQYFPEDVVSEVEQSLPQLLKREKYDIILIDDNWGADGDTAGQDRIMPCVLMNAIGEPFVTLFTHHWDEPYRSGRLATQIQQISDIGLLQRVWGISKSDASAFGLIIQRVVSVKAISAERDALKLRETISGRSRDTSEARGEMVGESAVMRALYKEISRVAKHDYPVLITGERGVGKELVAKAIHMHSRRKDHIYHAVQPSALSETLMESELFGHVKGAFANATSNRDGAFFTAKNGTLFLDEMGAISDHIQGKLHRALDPGEFKSVGSDKIVKVGARLIFATNVVLEELVRKGQFQQDLYDRLDVCRIDVPPLRDHVEDVPLLVQHFARGCRITDEAMAALMSYRWPGNVRELMNTLHRAIVQSDGNMIDIEHLRLVEGGDKSNDFSHLDKQRIGLAEKYLDEFEGACAIFRGREKQAALSQRELGALLNSSISGEAVRQRIATNAAEVSYLLMSQPSKWPLLRREQAFLRTLKAAMDGKREQV